MSCCSVVTAVADRLSVHDDACPSTEATLCWSDLTLQCVVIAVDGLDQHDKIFQLRLVSLVVQVKALLALSWPGVECDSVLPAVADRSSVHDDMRASAVALLCVPDSHMGQAFADACGLHGPHTLCMLPRPHHCRGKHAKLKLDLPSSFCSPLLHADQSSSFLR